MIASMLTIDPTPPKSHRVRVISCKLYAVPTSDTKRVTLALQEVSGRLDMLEKIAQRGIIKIEERGQNNGIVVDGWHGWMPPTAEKSDNILDVLAGDCGSGNEFLRPLDDVTGC